MKPFTESMRYEYPLTPRSVVIDCGGYEGNFAKTIAEKYGCWVHVFEPIPKFASAIRERLAHLPRVTVHECGIGGSQRIEKFHVQSDSTGIFAGSKDVVEAYILAIFDVLSWHDFWREQDEKDGEVALLKLNIEGSEFETLESLISSDWELKLKLIKNIQVQFHKVVPDFEKRHAAIREALLKTHQLTYDAPWCWENYERI